MQALNSVLLQQTRNAKEYSSWPNVRLFANFPMAFLIAAQACRQYQTGRWTALLHPFQNRQHLQEVYIFKVSMFVEALLIPSTLSCFASTSTNPEMAMPPSSDQRVLALSM